MQLFIVAMKNLGSLAVAVLAAALCVAAVRLLKKVEGGGTVLAGKSLSERKVLAVLFGGAAALYLVLSLAVPPHGDVAWYRDWGDYILDRGILNFLRDQDADYPPLFLYFDTALVWLARVLHVPFSFLFKPAVSAVVVVSAYPLFKILRKYAGGGAALIGTGAYLLHPVNILDTAIWGQTDVFISAAMIAVLYFLIAERWTPLFVSIFCAFAVKSQILFFLPVIGIWLIYIMVRRKLYVRFIVSAVAFVAALYLLYLPFTWTYIAEEGDYFYLFEIFFRQVGHWNWFSANAMNFWAAIGLNLYEYEGVWLKLAAYAVVAALSIALGVAVIRSKVRAEIKWPLAAFLQAGICFYFLPFMHERYFVPAVSAFISLLVLCKDEKLTLLGIALMALCALNVIFKLCFSVEEMKTLPAGLMIAHSLAGTTVFVLYGIRAFRYLLGKCGGAEEGVSAEDRPGGADSAEDTRQGKDTNGESAAECAAPEQNLTGTTKGQASPAEDKLFSDEAPPLAGT